MSFIYDVQNESDMKVWWQITHITTYTVKANLHNVEAMFSGVIDDIERSFRVRADGT